MIISSVSPLIPWYSAARKMCREGELLIFREVLDKQIDCAKILRSKLHFNLGVILLDKHYGPMIRILHCRTSQSVTNALEAMELTSAQGHIMGYLAHHATPPCHRDIEEAFHLSHPTVSGLLARMEKKGFIELRTDENDRRCKRIYVLQKGKECHEVIQKTIQCTEKRIVRDFTPEEQAQFASLLERAVFNMGGNPNDHHHKEENNT